MKYFLIFTFLTISLFSCKEDDDVVVVTIDVENFEITIDENPDLGQELGTLSAITSTGELSFQIESQDPSNAFIVNEETGVLTVDNETAFDYEQNPVINGLVKVINGDVSETIGVIIRLTNLDDALVTIDNFEVTIEENPEANQLLGVVQATSDQGDVTFTIESQIPEGAFQIDVDSGELRVLDTSLFDFETNEVITGIVGASSQNVQAEATITINLLDVKEITVTTSDLELSVDENPLPNQELGIVMGETNVGAVTFSIENQQPEGAFTIDAATGVLNVLDETLYDFEIRESITGVVIVENGDVSANANITINIINVDNCKESNLIFQQELIDYTNSNNNLNLEYTLDLTTHEYTFSPNTNLTLCSLGYQAYDDTPYLMEIEDGSGTILYSELMTFSDTEQDEVLMTTPVDLIAGESYTIRRIQNDYATIGEVIGFIILTDNFSEIDYPVNFNQVTMLSSNFYGTGGPIPNVGIPYITLGFD